jgi:Lar family restriction alleviation protein
MPQSDELMPCPFCGGSEEGFRRAVTGMPKLEELSAGGWRVCCYTCRVQTWDGLSREESIERWNTRAALQPIDGEVDTIYEWAWRTAVPGETSTETFKRGIEAALNRDLMS